MLAVALAAVVLGLISLLAVYRSGARNKNRVDINITTPPANRPSLTAPETEAPQPELIIRIRHNGQRGPVSGVLQRLEVFVGADDGFAEVTARRTVLVRYDGDAYDAMDVTINGARAKLPKYQVRSYHEVNITKGNYKSFLQ